MTSRNVKLFLQFIQLISKFMTSFVNDPWKESYLVFQLNDVLQHVDVDLFNDSGNFNRLNVGDPVPDFNLAVQTSGVSRTMASVPEKSQSRKTGNSAFLTSHLLLLGHDELDADVVDVVVDVLEAGHNLSDLVLAIFAIFLATLPGEKNRDKGECVYNVL